MLEYLEKGPKEAVAAAAVARAALSDDHMKMLNLTHDWLHSLLPFCLMKIDRVINQTQPSRTRTATSNLSKNPFPKRFFSFYLFNRSLTSFHTTSLFGVSQVSFGLLNAGDLARALDRDAKMPRSRKLLAVPFVGKDVPSAAAEFAHPDVAIGLTVLAYRYEGLRWGDFQLVTKVDDETYQGASARYVFFNIFLFSSFLPRVIPVACFSSALAAASFYELLVFPIACLPPLLFLGAGPPLGRHERRSRHVPIFCAAAGLRQVCQVGRARRRPRAPHQPRGPAQRGMSY